MPLDEFEELGVLVGRPCLLLDGALQGALSLALGLQRPPLLALRQVTPLRRGLAVQPRGDGGMRIVGGDFEIARRRRRDGQGLCRRRARVLNRERLR